MPMKICPTCHQSYPDKTVSCTRDGARLAAEFPSAQLQGTEPATAKPSRRKVAIGSLLLDLFLLAFIAFGCMSYFSRQTG